MTKGILISAWGKRGYIYAAYNLAFSIKNFNRMLPVYLYCDPQLLKSLQADQLEVFDEIIPIDISILQQHEKSPANIKITAYENLPFDYTLLLDVDALALQDLEPCINELIAQGGYFYSHILDLWTLDRGNQMPNMVWANADVIWEKYKLDEKAVLPCTNSSFQFIKKCPESKALFDRVKANLADPIPLDKLRTQWGAAQPDELYLNVAMAQMGITGKAARDYMFMGNYLSPKPYHMLQKEYYLLSVFGGRNFTKPRYTEWYDKLLVSYHRSHAKSAHYKFQYVVRDKHANTRPQKFSDVPSRFEVVKQQAMNTLFHQGKSGEKIWLFSGWYKTKTEQRQNELDKCLLNNLNNKEIERVFVVGEDECTIQHEKLTIINTQSRPTYNTFFQYINSLVDEDTISIICNGDIYFDEANARKLRGINYTNRSLALSRWEMDLNERPKHFNYEWSQDTWIFKGKVKNVSCETFLGVMQCDGRVAFEMKKAGYDVVNPSKDIQTYHIHKTGERTYDVNAHQEGEKMPVKGTNAQSILKKRLLINQPGKVGDIVICAPIAEFFSDEYFVDWLCPEKYHSLFKHLPYANPVTAFKERDYHRVVDLSFGLGGKPEKWWRENKSRFNSFVEAKYELAGIPSQLKYNLKWTRNTVNENALYELIKKDMKFDYILVHDSSDYGTPIKVEGKHVVKFQPILDYTIFDWYRVIMNATEIHCIDSSLCNFVDVIPEVKAKLFYYPTDRVPNKWDETIISSKWIRNETGITA